MLSVDANMQTIRRSFTPHIVIVLDCLRALSYLTTAFPPFSIQGGKLNISRQYLSLDLIFSDPRSVLESPVGHITELAG